MKSIFLLLGLLLISTVSSAQTIRGSVFDRESKESLPYVNIGIKGKKVGTVSDQNGNFQLDLASPQDSLVLSYIGYFTKVTIASSFSNEGFDVFMDPRPYAIKEVNVVSKSFDKEVILGVRNEKKRGHSIGFGNPQLGTELGARIRIEKETFIKSANFVLNHAKGDSLLLRINIYDYSKGEIGEKLLKKNIYVRDKQRKGTFTIELDEYEILLSQDVLLSLEWLRDFDEQGNKLITFDTKKSKKFGGTFIRSSKTAEFKQLQLKKKYKPCIYLIGKQSSK